MKIVERFFGFRRREGKPKASTESRTLSGQAAGGGSIDAPCGSTPTRSWRPGLHVQILAAVAQPLPEPFARLLDFDALEREAAEARQSATRQPQGSREPKGLRAFLLPDVTRTEELILTAELSRIGACGAVRPERRHANDPQTASRPLSLLLTERGLIVDLLS